VHSPVVELNRAVAVGMAEGPQAALAIVERIAGEPALKGYHLLPSVRGDLLLKLGRHEAARAAFEAAAALCGNKRERDLLERRAAEAAGRALQVERPGGDATADGHDETKARRGKPRSVKDD